jgi:hypothetical protein
MVCQRPEKSLTPFNSKRHDTLMYGEISAGMTPLSVHAFHSSAGSLPSKSSFYPAANDFSAYAAELIGAYGNFHQEAQKRLDESMRASLHCTRSKAISTFFGERSIFNRHVNAALI